MGKPDWDKLMKAFKDDDTRLVADVDCTAGGKALCDEVGVRGYPTIKYGDPNNMEDYNGARSYTALRAFAKTNLGPQCGPNRVDLCDDLQKANIEKFQKLLAAGALDEAISDKEAAMKQAEADFKTFVEG